MVFNLHTLVAKPDMNSADIDENWTLIAEAITDLQTQGQLGAVTIVSATTDENGLSFTLSNGVTLGPLPFSGTPMRVLGDWVTGFQYRTGDIVKTEIGSLLVKADHESDVLADDIAAGLIVYIAENGKNAIDYVSFDSPGAVTTGVRRIGGHIALRQCHLKTLTPVAVALVTPVSSGGSPVQIQLKKVTSAGVVTNVGTAFSFGPGIVAQTQPISVELAQYDVLAAYQTGPASPSGGDILISVALHDGATPTEL